jgi:hypothetical protein
MQGKKYKNLADLKFAMYVSVISLILMATVFVGTTFAWLTFTWSSDDNITTSSHFALSVYIYDENGELELLSDLSDATLIGGGAPFSKGSAGTTYIYVENTGTQALVLDIQMIVKQGFAAADAMKFKVTSETSDDGKIDGTVLQTMSGLQIEEAAETAGAEGDGGDEVELPAILSVTDGSDPVMVDANSGEIVRIDYIMYKNLSPEDRKVPLEADLTFVAVQSNVFGGDEQEKIYHVKDYEELQHALKTADDGAAIIFIGDITVDEGDAELVVYNSYSINLNGFTLSGEKSITFRSPEEHEEHEENGCYMLSIENGAIECEELHFDFDMSESVIHLLDDLVLDIIDGGWDDVYCDGISGFDDLEEIERFYVDAEIVS